MVNTTILLLCPGVHEVTEITGSLAAVERFEEIVLRKKATNLQLPSYSTPIYVMDDNESLVLATIEWNKIKEWPGQ